MKSDFPTKSLLIPVLASLLVGILAVSSKSLWIDEGLSAAKAMAPTFQEAWQRLLDEGNTNMHMLLYMASLWAWEKIFGHSEWALRAMNIPFFMGGVVALWLAIRKDSRIALLAAICLSPLAWFYLDDARTYSMLFAFSAIATALLIHWQNTRSDRNPYPLGKWSIALALSLAALAWTHIIGLIFQIGVVFFLFMVNGKRCFGMFPKCLPGVIALTISNIALIIYYLWTKSIGIEANPIGKTSLINLLFGVYEFLGFGGLGPNRNSLRLSPIPALLDHAIPLTILGILWGSFLLLALSKITKNFLFSVVPIFLGLILTPIAILYLLGVVEGVRVLPRYAMPSFPAIAVVIALLATDLWKKSAIGKATFAALAAFLAISCINLRWNPLHEKDDYRSASALAVEALAKHKTILWAADQDTGWYYGIDFQAVHPESGTPLVQTWTTPNITQDTFPEVVFLSKKDVYDGNGMISNLLSSLHYTARPGPFTFTIHEKPEESHQ